MTAPNRGSPTDANERAPAYSPDGRWIAYVSDGETGDDDQVYVRAAAGNATVEPLRVSVAGGTEPVWARTGSLLFFPARAHPCTRRGCARTPTAVRPQTRRNCSSRGRS